MRAKEFISEDLQKLDEWILPLIAAGGVGWQLYDTYNDIEAYRKGEITGAELAKRGITDLAFAAAGGAAGKALQKGWAFSSAGRKALWDAYKQKKAAADAAKKASGTATKSAQTATPKPGSTIQTPKGPRVAGVDGKPTTIDPTKRGARADIKKIKQAAKDQPAAGKAGAGVAAAAKKADDVIPPKGKGLTKGGVGAQALVRAKKASKGVKGKISKRAAGVTALANQVYDLNPYGGNDGDSAGSAAGKNVAGLGGDLVYTGTETNPEVVRIKGVNDPMPYMTKPSPYKTDPLTGKPKQPTTNDSNSPVPTAKDPKLPKQDTTSLATQQGVK